MQTNAYGKPIRDRELLRCIKKPAPATSYSRQRYRSFHPSSFANPATLLQKMRHLSLYSPNTNQQTQSMKLTTILLAAVITLPILCSSTSAQVCDDEGVFLGQLSANPYIADSTTNKFGAFGSPYSPTSVNNPYSQYGSAYSATSVSNPYATEAPKIIAADGQYLGQLSANPYIADSTTNKFGAFGSPYSPTSINNPYSQYGSPYSPISPNNPYATQATILCGDEE
jgi:hypothetical protein